MGRRIESSSSSSSSLDEQDSDTSVATATSATSEVSVEIESNRRPQRERKRKRNDDSLFEELELKYRGKKGRQSNKREKKSTKPTAKKEPGVKPNPNSNIERKAALSNIQQIMAAKNSVTTEIKPVKEKKQNNATASNSGKHSDPQSKPEVPLPDPQTSAPGEPNSAFDWNGDDLTPRKKLMRDEILRLNSLVPTTKPIEDTEDNTETAVKENKRIESGTLNKTKSIHADEKDGFLGSDEDKTLVHNDDDDDIYANDTLVEDGKSNGKGDREVSSSEPQEHEEVQHKHKTFKKKSKKPKKKSKKRSKHKKGKKGKKSKKSKRKYSSSSSDSSSSSSDDDSSSEEDPRPLLKKRKKLINYKQLQHNGPNDEVEEIEAGSGIYMNASALARVMGPAPRTHSSAARLLCRGVFTDEALRDCSVLGNPAKGPLGKPVCQRPALCPVALQAIHNVAKQIAISKKFKVMEISEVNNQIGTLQSELRNSYNKKR